MQLARQRHSLIGTLLIALVNATIKHVQRSKRSIRQVVNANVTPQFTILMLLVPQRAYLIGTRLIALANATTKHVQRSKRSIQQVVNANVTQQFTILMLLARL